MHKLVIAALAAGGALVSAAQAETLWVFCNAASGRAADIPPEVRDAFPVVEDEAEIAAAISAA